MKCLSPNPSPFGKITSFNLSLLTSYLPPSSKSEQYEPKYVEKSFIAPSGIRSDACWFSKPRPFIEMTVSGGRAFPSITRSFNFGALFRTSSGFIRALLDYGPDPIELILFLSYILLGMFDKSPN
jgi:hypothetical protein